MGEFGIFLFWDATFKSQVIKTPMTRRSQTREDRLGQSSATIRSHEGGKVVPKSCPGDVEVRQLEPKVSFRKVQA